MFDHNIVHILVAPPDKLDINIIKEAASILHKDPYEARLLLSGEIPKLISHYQSIQEANSAAVALKGLGLVTIVLEDAILREFPSAIFKAHALILGNGQVTFRDNAGRTTILNSQNSFLILKGRTHANTVQEETKTRMKFNLPATLMTGGFPVWRKVKETVKVKSSELGYFVILCNRISSEPIIKISEDYFDYSSLSSNVSVSSFTNINTIVVELRRIFPKAIFDDRLAKPGVMAEDEVELNCKLIYLYYMGVNNRPSA